MEEGFKKIHIVDPSTSDRTKKDVFAEIMKRHGYASSALLIVGDDLHSEIKAAQDLEIDTVLYDKHHLHEGTTLVPRISDFKQLESFLFSA